MPNPAAELTHAAVSIFFRDQHPDDVEADLWYMLMCTIETSPQPDLVLDAAFTYRQLNVLLRQLHSLVV